MLCAKLLQSCLTHYSPVDCSPPGSSVHGILQARILEWVAISSPSQGLNPCLLHLLHWQVDSLPLASPGKPGKNRGRHYIAKPQIDDIYNKTSDTRLSLSTPKYEWVGETPRATNLCVIHACAGQRWKRRWRGTEWTYIQEIPNTGGTHGK